MSDISKYTTGSINPKHLADTLIYKARFARDNPDYFYPAEDAIYPWADIDYTKNVNLK